MYIANMHFGKYRKGDDVPMDLPNNDERLKRGLIREVKIINPVVETKAVKHVDRKPARKTEQAK
tara:strand:- start:227 stop:418 length:192 start_codon:yes stop_codon:yes gene_type:complete